MAASATKKSREMGAVFGVAIAAYRQRQAHRRPRRTSQGDRHPAELPEFGGARDPDRAPLSGGAATNAEHNKNAAVGDIATKEVNAATYNAFGSGLHEALVLSGGLILAGAVVAALHNSPQAGRRRTKLRRATRVSVAAPMIFGPATTRVRAPYGPGRRLRGRCRGSDHPTARRRQPRAVKFGDLEHSVFREDGEGGEADGRNDAVELTAERPRRTRMRSPTPNGRARQEHEPAKTFPRLCCAAMPMTTGDRLVLASGGQPRSTTWRACPAVR